MPGYRKGGPLIERRIIELISTIHGVYVIHNTGAQKKKKEKKQREKSNNAAKCEDKTDPLILPRSENTTRNRCPPCLSSH
jgi:hypothetical protein